MSPLATDRLFCWFYPIMHSGLFTWEIYRMVERRCRRSCLFHAYKIKRAIEMQFSIDKFVFCFVASLSTLTHSIQSRINCSIYLQTRSQFPPKQPSIPKTPASIVAHYPFINPHSLPIQSRPPQPADRRWVHLLYNGINPECRSEIRQICTVRSCPPRPQGI